MSLAVLFDLDGTLLDSAPDLVGALNRVRRDEGLSALSVDDFRSAASRGAAGLIEAGLPPGDAQQTAQRKQAFLDHYQRGLYRDSRLFDGVQQVLDWLAESAVPWGVVTNKWERFALPVMRQSGLLSRAGCVICGDTLNRAKPDPAPVELALELLGASAKQAVMVGDDPRDVQSARAAGVMPVYAGWGYAADAPSDDPQTPVLPSAAALLDWLKAHFSSA